MVKNQVNAENRILAVSKKDGIVDCAVESSFIERVKYCHESRQLEVSMKGGKSYVYDGCSRQRFLNLVHADSVGKAYNELVKQADLECVPQQ
jgi:hypothetical protein